MSDFHVEVVRLEKIERHPNADTLEWSVVKEMPVLFKENQHKVGDKVVYVPPDALVPLKHPLFSWLDEGDIGVEWARIKGKKLRGMYSMGILAPLACTCDSKSRGVSSCDDDCLSQAKVGQNVQDLLGIKKWEPKISGQLMGESERDPGFMPVFTDIEALRRYPDILKYGEDVIMLEKIHGSNFRAVYWKDRLWVGSHYQFKKEDATNIYWKAAKKWDLENALKAFPGIAFYGEVFGHQKKFSYGMQPGEVDLRIFDAYNISTGRYLDWLDFVALKAEITVAGFAFPDYPPIIYSGPWADTHKEKRTGRSLMPNATNIREGFVVRPYRERYEHSVGRVIFKSVSEEYRVVTGQEK